MNYLVDQPFHDYWSAGRYFEPILQRRNFGQIESSVFALQRQVKRFSHDYWEIDAAVDFLGSINQECVDHPLRRWASYVYSDATASLWLSRSQLLRDWQAVSNKPIVPATCLARLFLRYAWVARGSDYASKVSNSAWERFRDRVQIASEIAKSVAQDADQFLPWFSLSLSIAKIDRESDYDDWYAILERGIDIAPTYWSMYVEAADFHLPRWCGSAEQFSDYLSYVVECTHEHAGKSVVAKIVYNLLVNYQFTVVDDLLAIDWHFVQRGFEDWLKQCPHYSILNMYLLVARAYEQEPTARELVKLIGKHPYKPVWSSAIGRHYLGYGGVCLWAKL